MNNPASNDANTSETRERLRRYPWITHEDIAILRALPPAQAREFERFLHNSANAASRQRAREITESDLDTGHPGEEDDSHTVAPLEHMHGILASRWQVGVGGGRRRTPYRRAA